MYRYTICPKPLGVYSCFYHIGIVATTTVAQGSKLVNVYTELCHAQMYLIRIKIKKELSGQSEQLHERG
jgi:hypothetical protein